MKVTRYRSIGISAAAWQEREHMDSSRVSAEKVRDSCLVGPSEHDVSVWRRWQLGPSRGREVENVARKQQVEEYG